MKKHILYIVGNGFDIHHQIPSRYSDFGAYLKNHGPELYQVVEQYFNSVDLWSDLEKTLATLDADALIEDASEFLVPYAVKDWSDSFHHNYQYEINEVVDKLSIGLKRQFTQWVYGLPIPSALEAPRRLDYLNLDAEYLTFNYTNSLKSIYSIPDSKVLFIHGKAAQPDSNLTLGHAWSPKEREPLSQLCSSDMDGDIRISEGNQIIDDYFKKTYKPTKTIIEQNNYFFERLTDIKTIYILGHSISEVDLEYFKKIVEIIDVATVRWNVSYHGNSELKRHKHTVKKLGIPVGLVEFFELPDMPLP